MCQKYIGKLYNRHGEKDGFRKFSEKGYQHIYAVIISGEKHFNNHFQGNFLDKWINEKFPQLP